MTKMSTCIEENALKVAVRVRPQSAREKAEKKRICITVNEEEAQVSVGDQHTFTFDRVFNAVTSQEKIFECCMKQLVDGVFDGYNATVLAYGQTGSGKTYTMGTSIDVLGSVQSNERGIVPRALQHIFNEIESRKQKAMKMHIREPYFVISAQFIELYNEEIFDLLSRERSPRGLRIQEDSNGGISINGVTLIETENAIQTMTLLKKGALNRRTASTNMNEKSSRSHAIFTVVIEQQRTVVVQDPVRSVSISENHEQPSTELELVSAKLHFVDLAGSENMKRTGATGDRVKEASSINAGLLGLGRVICALTIPATRKVHIPYRTSKLTRLLKDSLGGNSRTILLACVSPSDCDYVESLSTLRYANQAKDIKNKVIANQDKSSGLIASLRSRVTQLEAELLDYKQGRVMVVNGMESVSDQYAENVLLQADVDQLTIKVKALQETVDILKLRNVHLANENEACKRHHRGEQHSTESCVRNVTGGSDIVENSIESAIRIYVEELESQRYSLIESKKMNEQLLKQVARLKHLARSNARYKPLRTLSSNDEINEELWDANNATVPLLTEAEADIEPLKISYTESVSEIKNSAEWNEFEINELNDEELIENEAEMECGKLRDDLSKVQGNISLRERLVQELEESERRMDELRNMYEKRLAKLSAQIAQMEAEHKEKLSELAKQRLQKSEDANLRRTCEKYEKELNKLRDEHKKLIAFERDYRRILAKQAADKEQIVRFKNELNELKKSKEHLMKRIRDEAKQSHLIQIANMKKLADLEKESRRKDNIISKLEIRDRQLEESLKRSTDVVNRLREQTRQHRMERGSVQQKATTLRDGRGSTSLTQLAINKAKAKWHTIEKNIRCQINQRQAASKMEEELDGLLAERYKLKKEIGLLEDEYVEAEWAVREVIATRIDANHAKVQYVQRQILELQETMGGIKRAKRALYEWSDEKTEKLLGTRLVWGSGKGKSSPKFF